MHDPTPPAGEIIRIYGIRRDIGEDIAKTSKNTLKSVPFSNKKAKDAQMCRSFSQNGTLLLKNAPKTCIIALESGTSDTFSEKTCIIA